MMAGFGTSTIYGLTKEAKTHAADYLDEAAGGNACAASA
jgi:hypothetical protein